VTGFAVFFATLSAGVHVAPGAVLWSGNGNHYDLVLDYRVSWSDARDAAEATDFMGVSGHLVTITSAAENQFISDNFSIDQSSQFA
jgi:hypothetical protein